MLDVHTNPANPVIGNRAFGPDPTTVITHALAFWAGLRAAGVLGCGKHFPGHGDTALDSHHDLPTVPHSLERLRTVELAPFAAAVQAGAEALMSAHVLFPAMDPARPATLSAPVLTGLVRGQLGFQGLLVSDDLGMKAVADRFSVEDIVTEGLAAGLDHFIIRGPQEQQLAAWEALITAVERSPALAARLEQSLARIVAFKTTMLLGSPIGATQPSTTTHKSLPGSPGRSTSGWLPALAHAAPASIPRANHPRRSLLIERQLGAPRVLAMTAGAVVRSSNARRALRGWEWSLYAQYPGRGSGPFGSLVAEGCVRSSRTFGDAGRVLGTSTGARPWQRLRRRDMRHRDQRSGRAGNGAYPQAAGARAWRSS